MEIDGTDLKILAILQQDARTPNIVLAEKVGLSPSPCSRRVRLLEQAGVLEQYRAAISRTAIGLSLTVFIGIRVERHSLNDADAFVASVLEMSEVVAFHLVSGDHDFLIEAVVPDMIAYEATVLRALQALPEIRDIRTSFAMRTYRSNGPVPLKPA